MVLVEWLSMEVALRMTVKVRGCFSGASDFEWGAGALGNSAAPTSQAPAQQISQLKLQHTKLAGRVPSQGPQVARGPQVGRGGHRLHEEVTGCTGAQFARRSQVAQESQIARGPRVARGP